MEHLRCQHVMWRCNSLRECEAWQTRRGLWYESSRSENSGPNPSRGIFWGPKAIFIEGDLKRGPLEIGATRARTFHSMHLRRPIPVRFGMQFGVSNFNTITDTPWIIKNINLFLSKWIKINERKWSELSISLIEYLNACSRQTRMGGYGTPIKKLTK